MILKTHPFNRNSKQTLINENTTKLIIGSFPSNELTPYNGNAAINYFYGNLSRFWQIIRQSHNLNDNFENDIDLIKGFLKNNQIGIIDIIYKCYRLNDTSALDTDLSIIELENIPEFLEKFQNITKIYTTSNFVRNLLISKQIRPLVNNHIINNEVDNNQRRYENISLFNRNIHLYRLKSPSRRAGYTDQELINDYSIL